MIKPSVNLQELRRRIYRKAKAEKTRRFWGLYVHVCKMETLRAAYQAAKANDGTPGIDGESFQSIEARGVGKFLSVIREELLARTYQPSKNRRVEIPKGNGKTRRLGIPTIKDRVVQGAVKLILEAIFEADFHTSSTKKRPRWWTLAGVRVLVFWGSISERAVIDSASDSFCGHRREGSKGSF